MTKPSTSFRERIERAVTTGLQSFLKKRSLQSLHKIGDFVGHVVWLFFAKRREATVARIKKHIPELAKTDKEARAFAHSSMCENGKSFLELFAVQKYTEKSIGKDIYVAEPELYHQLTHSDRPIVTVTAHLGSWELMAGLLGCIFPKEAPCAVVVRKQKLTSVQEVMEEQRSCTGAKVIYHRQAAPQVLRTLKKNGVVAFLGDHNARINEALFMPFLGQTAAVNKGPALLAIRAKAIIWPACLVRSKNTPHTHIFRTYPPLDTKDLTGSLDEQIAKASEFITQNIEDMVRTYPEQWFWMHNRWKTQEPKN